MFYSRPQAKRRYAFLKTTYFVEEFNFVSQDKHSTLSNVWLVIIDRKGLSHTVSISVVLILGCASMGFPRQECWNGLPSPSRGSSDSRIKPESPVSPTLARYHCATWEAQLKATNSLSWTQSFQFGMSPTGFFFHKVTQENSKHQM